MVFRTKTPPALLSPYASPPPTPSQTSAVEDPVQLGSDVCETSSPIHSLDVNEGGDEDELSLLEDTVIDAGSSAKHELDTAPLLTRTAYQQARNLTGAEETQYGVLGRVVSINAMQDKVLALLSTRVYVNTNAPFSAVICGVQGAGKSHTVSVLLESMFIQDYTAIGKLTKPLSGLVLHYGEGGAAAKPCEAAWLGVPAAIGVQVPQITVFVSPSSLNTMRNVYARFGNKVTVHPLYLSEAELDAESFKALMGISLTDANPPLYMQIIMSILRNLGEKFTYRRFQVELEQQKLKFNAMQLTGLEQRMWLLNSFMKKTGSSSSTSSAPRFACGQLTIVDLSDPFIDATSACGLFEILTRLFVRADVRTGKVLLVDEAHKYLCVRQGSSVLTERLARLVRQQRHLGMRVIISTQEPTVVPSVLLDLCSVAILHRFSSPSWWEHLRKHVSANLSDEDGFNAVVKLKTGEAVVLAPSGLITTADNKLQHLGRQYMVMKTRRRVTADGGSSVLVV